MFKKSWNGLDKSLYFKSNQLKQSREQSSEVSNTIDFLKQWITREGKTCVRKDYKEMAELTLLFLGDCSEDNCKVILAPGACHHARWMARIIYTLKMALFRCQLENTFDSVFLENVSTLALFLWIYYLKPWLCCAIASETPKTDLTLFKKFQRVIDNHKKYSKRFQEFAVLCQSKLKNHLCTYQNVWFHYLFLVKTQLS